MEKSLPLSLQEVIFGSSRLGVSRQITRWEREGKIRKIAPRIYSANLTDPVDTIVRRNLWHILAHQYPGAVISHRTAFEFQPTEAGHVFLTYTYTKKISLAGLTIRLLEGKGAVDGDNPFFGQLHASHKARALLENLQPARNNGPESKCLPISAIEEKLEEIVRVHSENELNRIREEARRIAPELGMEAQFDKLNRLISALLATGHRRLLSSPLAIARAMGEPYDADRVELFSLLFRELKAREFRSLPDRNISPEVFQNFAFYESYFSNYIEGTVFAVEEARQIVRTQQPLPARHGDSYDVLGTYQIVSSREEMSVTPASAYELQRILLYRHRVLLGARTEKNPGLFKDRDNFAGSTSFVDYQLVKGTLAQSFGFYQVLEQPFARAAYLMFVISEVHPFLDGNGRVARVMMNAELVKAGQAKIIIPTVFREDYMGALRKLTRRREPDAYIRMLQKAHEFSATIHGEDIGQMQQQLEQSNAFVEHTEAKLRIIIQ